MAFIVAVVIHIPIFFSRYVPDRFPTNVRAEFLSTFPVLYSSLTALFGQVDIYTITFVQVGSRLPATAMLPKSVFAHRA